MDVLVSIQAARPDWELSLIVGEDGPLAARAKHSGIHAVVAPFPRRLARLGDSGARGSGAIVSSFKAVPAVLGYARQLRRLIGRLQPDIVHTNGFKMHVLSAWSVPRNIPVIWHVRDYVSSRPLMKRMLRAHASRCTVAIANSNSVAEDIAGVCGSALETVSIYNAIDLNRYSPAGPALNLDSVSGLDAAPAATVRIGLVGTMAHWKGHGVFLRAIAALPKDLPYRAYIIGGPIYQTDHSQRTVAELRSFTAQLGIANRVGFTGYAADTASAMRALDIVVHASTQPEPFGRVIAEAMACGRAVICSAAGGARELITEGHDALAHTPGDHLTLAQHIERLIRDPELRARLGRAGRATAEQRFDRARLAEQLIPVYLRLAAQAPSTAEGQAMTAITH